MQKKIYSNKYLSIGFAFTVLLVLIVGIAAYMHPYQPVAFFADYESIQTIDTPWSISNGKDTYDNVDLPSVQEYDLPDETVYMYTTLPDNFMLGASILYRNSMQEITVFIDGKEIYNYGDEDFYLLGHSCNSVWNIIDLPYDCRGGELRILLRDPYPDHRPVFHQVLYGTHNACLGKLFHDYGLNLLLIVFTMAVGLLMLVASIFMHFSRMGKSNSALNIGVFAVLISFWQFSECKLTPMLVDNMAAWVHAAYMSLALLPIPLLFYVDRMTRFRYRKYYVTLETLLGINVVAQIILQCFDVADYYQMLKATHGLLILTVVLVGFTATLSFIREKTTELAMFFVSCIGLCASVIFELVALYTSGTVNGIGLSLGMLLLITCLAMSVFHQAFLAVREGKRAEQENLMKSTFLANMSHEIRTPMNAICAMSELLESSESLNENDKSYAETIHSSAMGLLDIINDILDFSKITAGKYDIVNSDYDLMRVIGDVRRIMLVPANKKNLDLAFYIDPSVPCELYGDENRLRQILINVINNAVKYTKKGKVSVCVSSEPCEDNDVLVSFAVTDTGIGIKEEDLSNLFNAFVQVDPRRNRAVEGTGLGLAITKAFAELMGGNISVTSEYGVGSTFTVSVRQTRRFDTTYVDLLERAGIVVEIQKEGILYVDNISTESDIDKPIEKFTAPEARVMIVDDSNINLRIMREILKVYEMKITLISSAKQALAAVRTKEYDLIFMDHMMPEMDGVEATEKILAMNDLPGKKPKIIALTANAIKGMEQMFLEKGFDGYLSKPVSVQQINRALIRFLPDEKIVRE